MLDVLNDVLTLEFLKGLKCSRLSNRELNLQTNAPIMLPKNIDHSLGMCNGTHLVVTRLGKYVLEAKILTENNYDQKVFIPRMSLTPLDQHLHFKFEQQQFSFIIFYAMMVNKSQGQSLSYIGLFLKKLIFSHG